MSKIQDNKLEQPPVSQWIISPLRIVNLILALFSLASILPFLNYCPMTGLNGVFLSMLFIWLVCAFFLFFRSRIAWFCSLLGLGLMVFEYALASILTLEDSFKAEHASGSPKTACIYTISLILSLTVFFGLLKYRRAWK